MNKAEKKAAKLQQKNDREEALAYLKEVINANRAIKDWMFRNTNYAVLAEAGVYAIFKSADDLFSFVLAIFLMVMIWGVALYVLNSNRESIERLREKERSLIEGTPLPLIEKNWAGTAGKRTSDLRYFAIYSCFILLTGCVLLLALSRENRGVRATACGVACVQPEERSEQRCCIPEKAP